MKCSAGICPSDPCQGGTKGPSSVPSQHVLPTTGAGKSERQEAWRTQSQQCLKDSKGAEKKGVKEPLAVSGVRSQAALQEQGSSRDPKCCSRSAPSSHCTCREEEVQQGKLPWSRGKVAHSLPPPHWKMPCHGAEQCSKGCRNTVPQDTGLAQESLCPVSLWVTSSHSTSSSGPQEDAFPLWTSRL